MRFIVNHGGVVHAVNDDQFALHLGLASKPATPENPAGSPAREATPDEVIAHFARQGLSFNPATGEATPALAKLDAKSAK
jgi:hypothetical protein